MIRATWKFSTSYTSGCHELLFVINLEFFSIALGLKAANKKGFLYQFKVEKVATLKLQYSKFILNYIGLFKFNILSLFEMGGVNKAQQCTKDHQHLII